MYCLTKIFRYIKNLEKEPIKKGIQILEELVIEIGKIGEKAVIEKYHK